MLICINFLSFNHTTKIRFLKNYKTRTIKCAKFSEKEGFIKLGTHFSKMVILGLGRGSCHEIGKTVFKK